MNILRYAFKNIFRNFFLSISSIIIISLLIFFVNILLFVQFAADQLIDNIQGRISFTINYQTGFTDQSPRSKLLISSLEGIFTGASIEYVSKEQAFETLKARNPDLATLVEHADENPLPNSLTINNIRDLTEYQKLPQILEKYQDVLQYDKSRLDKKIVDFETQYKNISKVVSILQIFQYGIFVLLGLFIFTVFAIVHMIIRNFIYFLQDEVRIIELVG
jgi:cell division transport system permease protein